MIDFEDGVEPDFNEVKHLLSSDENVQNALALVWANIGYDGGHHKQWLIAEMVRALLGDEKYELFKKLYEKPYFEDGEENFQEFDEGVAP